MAQHDTRQPLTKGYYPTATADAAATSASADLTKQREAGKKAYDCKRALMSLKGKVLAAKARAENPVDLQKYKVEKAKKNSKTETIGALGPAKIDALLEAGFVTLRQFVDLWNNYEQGESCDEVEQLISAWRQKIKNGRADPTKLPQEWAESFEKVFNQRLEYYEEIEEQAAALSQQAEDALQTYKELETATTTTTANQETETASTELEEDNKEILPFSDMRDKDGYNAKFLSADRIEAILQTSFRDQKPYMKAAMQQLGGRILSLDFFHPLASRIWVKQNDGTRFHPYKCIADIKNEDGLII